MRKKAGIVSLVALLAVFITLLFVQFAFATVVSGEGTGPQTGGGTGTSGAATTGAPLVAIGSIGAAIMGAGYFLRRRSGK